jgi:hypothetical protein
MASALVALRFLTFGFFIICNTILCSVGVWNLSLVQTKSVYNAQIAAYMIFLGAFSLVWIFPLIFIDLLRRNALTSRIWVEMVWVTIFWIMELSGAAALSAIVPNNQCLPRRGRTAANVCLSGKVLLGFAWVITLILLAYMVMLAVYAVVHHATDPNVWSETVREYPWFSTRSTLSSSPPSPTAEKGPEVPSLRHPRPQAAFNPAGLTRELSPFEDPIQPVPTFDSIPQPSYQPPQRCYEGPRFASVQDPVPNIDPTFMRPREAPRPPAGSESLYPQSLQAYLSMEARNNLHSQSKQLEGQEPSPIGDWPRNTRSKGHTKRLPPPPPPRINTEANVLTQQPFSSISPDQRMRLSGTTNTPSPSSYGLGSPIWGPQSTSTRRQPPPPLNLDGISNTHGARR